ncbi:hypothetical protein BDP27DRAFT_1200966, partial [Rhodocollybia butyracea]
KSRIVSPFMNYDVAVSHYMECLHTGVIDVLKADETPTTFYDVTKGFEPGVYRKRLHVLATGLNWRGGEVTWSEGTSHEVAAVFQRWKDLGHVTIL